MSFIRFPIFFLVLLLIIFSASLGFAAADQSKQLYDTTAGLNSTPTAAWVDTTSEYTQGVHIDFGVETIVRAPQANSPDSPTDLATKYFHEHFTLPFYNRGETTWSIASLSDKFSSNPVTDFKNLTDIKNFEVLLQFKF